MTTKQIVACSFDGTANMSGQYSGLQAFLQKDNEKLVYVHCYAHRLNLVLTNGTEKCKTSLDYFKPLLCSFQSLIRECKYGPK